MPRFEKSTNGKVVVLNGDKTGQYDGLSYEQAYHLWVLSFEREFGNEFPIERGVGEPAPAVRRISSWFSDELDDEFLALWDGGKGPTPVEMYNRRKKWVNINLTVRVPAEWTGKEIHGEIRDVINDVTEDTQIEVK